jgi:GxxExxY protein
MNRIDPAEFKLEQIGAYASRADEAAPAGYWAYKELTDKVIGCVYRVYNTMGPGFLESVYLNCLLIELAKLGLSAEAEKAITVYYEGHVVGEFIVDILVERSVILELKAIRELHPVHEVQLVNYLQATCKDVGLLINFGEKEVQISRKVRKVVRSVTQANPAGPLP